MLHKVNGKHIYINNKILCKCSLFLAKIEQEVEEEEIDREREGEKKITSFRLECEEEGKREEERGVVSVPWLTHMLLFYYL